MRLRTVGIFGCLLVVLFAGCKSVETTSSMLHNDAGRYDLAIEAATEALAKNPNDAEAEFQLGVAYSNLDSVGQAYEHFVKAEELDPKRETMVRGNIQSNFAKHYNSGLRLAKDPDKSLAAAEFKKATEADPTQASGFFMLGRTYAAMGYEDSTYFDLAIPNLDKVLELSTPADKHYIDALSLAGEVLAKSGRPEDAVSRFNRLVEEDPTNYDVIEKIGYDLLNSKDWKGAAVFLALSAKARSKIGADDFTLFYNLGVANYQMRKEDPSTLPKAIEYYEAALNLQPDEPTTTFNIVVAHVAGKDWMQAQTWGEKYISTNPNDEDGWKVLSRIYTELGDQEKARHCLDRYEEIMKSGGGAK